MARTDHGRVQTILEAGGNYRCGVSLVTFIKAATRIINRVVTCAAAKGITIGADDLLEMESWLAAHVYTRSDPTWKSRSTLRASGSNNSDTRDFLEVALALDPSGCLSEIMNTDKTASLIWLGKPPSSQIDYVDRD